MEIEDVLQRLQYMADLSDALLGHLRSTFTPITPAAHDDHLPLAPGDVVLDSVTGQPVEILSGQRIHHDV